MPERIAIIGAGQIAKQVLAHLQTAGTYNVIGAFDDNKPKGTAIWNTTVIGTVHEAMQGYNDRLFDKLLVAVGYANMSGRLQLFKQFQGRIPFASFVHPSAFVDKSVTLGENVIIYPGCVIDVNCEIGSHVFMNCGCVISHDSNIGENTVLAPRVTLSGFCSVGSSSFLGSATTVIDSITIGSQCFIGAGSLIVKNIPDQSFGYGTPFKTRNVK